MVGFDLDPVELRLPAVEFLRELLTYTEQIGCYFLIIASRMSA